MPDKELRKPHLRIRKLRSLTACAREIETLYRKGRENEITTQDMGRYVCAIQTLSGVLKDHRVLEEFADRIESIEAIKL